MMFVDRFVKTVMDISAVKTFNIKMHWVELVPSCFLVEPVAAAAYSGLWNSKCESFSSITAPRGNIHEESQPVGPQSSLKPCAITDVNSSTFLPGSSSL